MPQAPAAERANYTPSAAEEQKLPTGSAASSSAPTASGAAGSAPGMGEYVPRVQGVDEESAWPLYIGLAFFVLILAYFAWQQMQEKLSQLRTVFGSDSSEL